MWRESDDDDGKSIDIDASLLDEFRKIKELFIRTQAQVNDIVVKKYGNKIF